VIFGGRDTAQSRALREGYLLSDDPIGDFDPQARRGSPLYVPDVALGRLVETPEEIERQFAQYQDSGGVLDPASGFVSGYDFVKDGAAQIRDALAPALPGGSLSSRIDETWGAADALAGINTTAAAFTSVNGHYDHFRALPAAAFNGTQPDLLHARDAAPAGGSLLFNLGCHGGLNVPAVSVALASETERLGDWPQRAAGRGALTVGNTGYGYGDTETVAYSERLIAEFARNVGSGDVAAGQALLFAKQHYAATLGTGDDYDAKALAIGTFYGPPTSPRCRRASPVPPARRSACRSRSTCRPGRSPADADATGRFRASTRSSSSGARSSRD
jgi:hypothetical protein